MVPNDIQLEGVMRYEFVQSLVLSPFFMCFHSLKEEEKSQAISIKACIQVLCGFRATKV